MLGHPGGSLGDYLGSSCFWQAVGVGLAAGAISGLIVGVTAGLGLLGTGFWGVVGYGALGGGVSGVVAESIRQVLTYGQVVDPASVAVAGVIGAISGAVTSGAVYGIGSAARYLSNEVARTLTVETPYGPARQSVMPTALWLRNQVAKGAPVYRGGQLGKSAAAEGQFWAPENPLGPGYTNRYGVASFTEPGFVLGGTMRPGSRFITRPAPAVGSHSGGALEIVSVVGAVRVDFFHMP